ncbi:MAG: tRNA lysidine(34) synthetase TilS [Bacteroidales bacterium]|nr:tRNA lysidine(34) synthetase TilS [Bacteroidales bacterium]
MLNRFKHTVEEMRGLIDDSRSASVSMDDGGRHRCRKNPSHLVGPSPCGQGGSTLSAPVPSTTIYSELLTVISSESPSVISPSSPVISSESPSVISSERSESRNLYLLAVSGGIDSMCLADLWLRCFGAESFAIAHCNFHLRGEESDGDEALVTKWAEENGVLLHRVDFDTAGYAAENGLSIEMAARELRYTWFGELCDKHGYNAVVVAHHADDNAETLVLNMVRGAGLKGLTGMKPVSPLSFRAISPLSFRASEASREISILRPLLTFTRKQIEGHVFAWKVPYREDSTNSSVEYRRNSIRHEVFPLFERMNPSYVRTLNREMTYLSDASSIVEDWCKAHIPHVLVPLPSEPSSHLSSEPSSHLSSEPGSHLSFRPSSPLSFRPSEASGEISISIPRLLEIPQWRYLLYYILEPYGFNTSVLESLENLLTSGRTISGKRFESAGYVLRTERESLVVCIRTSLNSPLSSRVNSPLSFRASSPLSFRASEASREIYTTIRTPGAYHVNGRRILVETLPWTPDMPLKQPAGTLIFDAAKLKFPFVCRVWRNGDWLIPLGMKGKKKLSDLFTDLKYSHFEKESSLVIVDCNGDYAEKQHVSAVLPVRIDDRYKVTSDTTEIIRIRITDNR